MNKKTIKTTLFTSIVILIITVLFFLFVFLYPNFTTSKNEKEYLHIYPNSSVNNIKHSLIQKTNVLWVGGFDIVAKALRFEKPRTGRYEIRSGMNNLDLVRMLRNGQQTPLRLSIKPVRTTAQLAKYLSTQLMEDSTSFMKILNDSIVLEQYNLEPKTVISIFIPNSYEVFWNTSAENFLKKMNRQSNDFWNKKRLEKAEKIPLSRLEVCTLASIVDSETNSKKEKPIVAGLYINRLRKGIPLQADPTVIYAVGDFSIRRVLLVHTRTESPYNTYMNKGLPPGPIRTPTISGIDAVLNYDKNDYIFMCASELFNGEHNFAKTLSQHTMNARKYQKALNERGIK